QLGRVAVRRHRTVGRFPDRELLARAGAAAEHRLELALLPDADARLAGDLLFGWHVRGHPFRHLMYESVGVAVDVVDLVVPEVHRVGLRDPCPTEEGRMGLLQR